MRVPKGKLKTHLGEGFAVGIDLEGSRAERLIIQITEPNSEGKKRIHLMKTDIFGFHKNEYTVVS